MRAFKICLLGVPGVGKTSIARRAALNTFSGDYLSTIGIDIYDKVIELNNESLKVVMWDVQGHEKWSPVLPSYVKNSDGIIYIAEHGTFATVEGALDLHHLLVQHLGENLCTNINFVLNKDDIMTNPKVIENVQALSQSHGWNYFSTSAKEGNGINEVILNLCQRM